jgi:predicted DNA-binding transcriptional regulator YafY
MPNPEECRRARRVIETVLLIAGQPRHWSRRRLAERFEVSEQQLDKDIALIRHGIVKSLRRSPRGYYFERIGYLLVAPCREAG